MNLKLKELLDRSYTPYYHYPVSACIVMKDGREFYGVNVETSSPAAGICAERNALYSAVTQGYGKGDIKEIHVKSKTQDDCFPCFICRHTLSDFCDRDVLVTSHTYNDEVLTSYTIEELCPHPFGDDNMK